MAKIDDIPEAVRRISTAKSSKSKSKSSLDLRWLIISLGVLILLSLAVFFRSISQSSPEVVSSPTPSPTPTIEAIPEAIENILGHLPYEEAPESDLKAITSDGRIRLRSAAADKFKQMQAAARAEGIILTPISGFRSVAEQEYLFFQIKAQRNQETRKRAEVSAPPGYSEHHTGYAIDIGDGKAAATNLQESFENTAAFRWLEANAARYSFELSFPRDNPQGISYEPWHWRFVGDTHSLKTFFKAQELKN